MTTRTMQYRIPAELERTEAIAGATRFSSGQGRHGKF